MKAKTLLFLRISLGLLLVIWGIDKFADVEHGLAVSDHFYFGVFSRPLLLRVFGLIEIVSGVLIIVGVLLRFVYPILLAITGVTLLGVWRSVIDPWGWWLEGANVLFYPSLIIFAASLVLWAFRDESNVSTGRADEDAALTPR